MERNWTEDEYANHMRSLITPEMQAKIDASYRAYVAEGRAAQKARRGRMNKLETAFSAQLQSWQEQGILNWWAFEPIKLRLAYGAWFTPDFATDGGCGLRFYETKGFWREAARVRIKVAADKYPFEFTAVTKDRKTGEWQYEHFRGRV